MQKIQHLWVSWALMSSLLVSFETQAASLNEYIEKHQLSKELVQSCFKALSFSDNAQLTPAQRSILIDCFSKKTEVITVHGQQWLPQEVEISGQHTLSRDFLDRTVVGNGNITDMLTILPGIQGSEDANNVENQAEIKSKLISISGGRPSDTGFYIDGQSNNSELDPDGTSVSITKIDDVQGHPQQTFVNQAVVGHVKVFDSNIPVEYGGFNGGVVDVELRDESESPRFQFDYRVSDSSFNRYKLIDNVVLNEDGDSTGSDKLLAKPVFKKSNINLVASQRLSSDQSVSLSLSHTTSDITDISLLKPVTTSRESSNFSLGYSVKNTLMDSLRFRLNYSPYQGNYIRKDVLNSDFSIKGGGAFASLSVDHSWDWLDYSAKVRYGVSQNSRTAPQSYFPWLRAKGKNWGVNTGSTPLSKEGGYGDIKKHQKSLSLNQKFNVNV